MQRIPTLLKKITEMAERGDNNTVIDIDLMMDYTRVVYADLLEWRGRKSFVASLADTGEQKPAEPVQKQQEISMSDPIETEATIILQEEDDRNEEENEQEAEIQEEIKEPEPVIELVVNPPATKPAKDIRRAIGINDKFLYMSELFGNDRDSYEQALDTINTFGSYAEAEQWVNKEVKPVQTVGEDNDTLESFRNMLHLFFNTH